MIKRNILVEDLKGLVRITKDLSNAIFIISIQCFIFVYLLFCFLSIPLMVLLNKKKDIVELFKDGIEILLGVWND